MKGVSYYLTPDFSEISSSVILSAIGQAFFSLAIGWGILVTYGSYLSKTENILEAGLWVGLADTLVALMSGLMIFPAVFAFGKSPAQGTALVFEVLPEVFDAIPAGGQVLGAAFFVLLAIAALTSAISIIEVPAAYLMDEKNKSRTASTWIVTFFIFILSIPSALASGGHPFFTEMQVTLLGVTYHGFLNIIEYLFVNMVIIISSLMICLYGGWIFKTTKLIKEIDQEAGIFTKKLIGTLTFAKIWSFFIKYVCPVLILMVLIQSLFGSITS